MVDLSAEGWEPEPGFESTPWLEHDEVPVYNPRQGLAQLRRCPLLTYLHFEPSEDSLDPSAALAVGLPQQRLQELYLPRLSALQDFDELMRGVARVHTLRRLHVCVPELGTLLGHYPPPRWLRALQDLHLEVSGCLRERVWLHSQLTELAQLTRLHLEDWAGWADPRKDCTVLLRHLPRLHHLASLRLEAHDLRHVKQWAALCSLLQRHTQLQQLALVRCRLPAELAITGGQLTELVIENCNGNDTHWRSLAAAAMRGTFSRLQRLDLSVQRTSVSGVHHCSEIAKACGALTWLHLSTRLDEAEAVAAQATACMQGAHAVQVECVLSHFIGSAFTPP